MMNEINKIPHNVEAEEKLIASCILPGDTSVLDSVSPIVSPEDFYTLRGKILYTAITRLAGDNKPLDEVSVCEALKGSNSLDEVGGMQGFMSLMDGATTESQAIYYANLVAEKSKLRSLIRDCRLAIENAESEDVPFGEIRSKLEGSMLDIDSSADISDGIESAVDEILSDVKQMWDGEFKPDIVQTNVGRLDGFLGNGGIAAGEVLTLAAPTSCGKSALALYMSAKALTLSNTPTAYFSFEMPRKQLMKRMIQSISGVNIRNIQEGSASDANTKSFEDASERIKTLPLYTSHTVKSAEDLVSQCRYFVRKKGVKLVVIDYLQLIPFSGNKGKAEGIADISHKIKQMAIELNVSVVLLAQINREGAKREGSLNIYDLKDSGDIENDADIVLLMWPYKGDVEQSKDQDHKGPYTGLFYKLAKNREGERDIGDYFKFYHCTGRFE